jgi:hypothetical protein
VWQLRWILFNTGDLSATASQMLFDFSGSAMFFFGP